MPPSSFLLNWGGSSCLTCPALNSSDEWERQVEGKAGKDKQTCGENPEEWRSSAGIAELKWKSFGKLAGGSLSFSSRFKLERFMVPQKCVQISSLSITKMPFSNTLP